MEKIYFHRLRSAAEPEYAAFQSRIASDTGFSILGVRMDTIRRLARQAAGEDWKHFLWDPSWCYEQVMLMGLAIAYARVPLEEKLPSLRQLLPRLDSWALTDSIAPTIQIAQEEREQARAFALEALQSSEEYSVRFGIVLLLRHFLSPQDRNWTAQQLCAVQDRRYYVQMAQAWCFAEMAVGDYPLVYQLLQEEKLDRFVHNKTIQKMRESYRISKEQKEAVQRLRRK